MILNSFFLSFFIKWNKSDIRECTFYKYWSTNVWLKIQSSYHDEYVVNQEIENPENVSFRELFVPIRCLFYKVGFITCVKCIPMKIHTAYVLMKILNHTANRFLIFLLLPFVKKNIMTFLHFIYYRVHHVIKEIFNQCIKKRGLTLKQSMQ